MYSKIYDPISKKKFNINSKKGICILKKYCNIIGGKPSGKTKKIEKMESIPEEIQTMEELIKIQDNKIQKLESAIKFYKSHKYKKHNFNEIIANIYIKLGWAKEIRNKYSYTKYKPKEIPTLEEFEVLAILSDLDVNHPRYTYGIDLK